MSAERKSRVDDEDDLDDLDDVLDEFSKSAPPPPPPPPPATAGASSSSQPSTGEDEALMKELEEEMASLFKGLGADRSEDSDGATEREFAAAWQAMLVQGMDSMASGTPAPAPATTSSIGQKENDFQSRIRSAMNKLSETESGLQSSDPSASGTDPTFQSLLSQLEGLGDLAGDGTGDDEQLQGVLEAMMGQLMSKEVLYEPLKELHDKFPEYLAKNNSTLSPEDKKRFEAQMSCIEQLLREFEAKTYSDDDDKTREKVVELMSELQTHGSPPQEIMGPLPPGFNMGKDGLPDLPEGCNVI